MSRNVLPRTTPRYSSSLHRSICQGAQLNSTGGALQPSVPDCFSQSGRLYSLRVGSHSSPLVRCVAPPSTAQQIYGVGGQQQQPQIYGVVVPMTKLRRSADGDGVTRVRGTQDDWTLQTAAHYPQSWPSGARATVMTRSVSAEDYNHHPQQQRQTGRQASSPTSSSSSSSMMYPTNFSSVISASNKPCSPPVAVQHTAKVKLIARVSGVESGVETCLTVDKSSNHVVLHEPSLQLTSTSHRQRSVINGPKLFMFDQVFSPDDSLGAVCQAALTDVLHSVVSGCDGCVLAFGPTRVGKTYTMIGLDDGADDIGVIPSAISWLYQLIEEQKQLTGARFSVRVSAVELTGQQETLRDLLSVSNSQGDDSPGVYLREDAVSGMSYLENQSEVRAATADVAARLLDAAIAARTVPATDENSHHSHLLFTLSVYQYRVQTTTDGHNNVVGGRRRLQLVDLGSCSRSRDGSSLSLTSLGAVITSLLSGQRQVPYRDHKLTQLLRESLGSATCNTCAIIHVSPASAAYSDSLQVMQLASRMHQTRLRRRPKLSSSSDESSCDGSSSGTLHHWYGRRRRAGVKMGVRRSYQRSHSDPECLSSSEQSCDTAIYVGSGRGMATAALSDREFTDSETASSVITIQSPRLLHNMTPVQHTTLTSRDSTNWNSPGIQAATAAAIASGLNGMPSPRRRFPRLSASPQCPATIPEHPDEELWIDGPRSSVCPAPAAKSVSHTQISYSDKCASQSANAISSHKFTTQSAPSSELWVDGPVELRTQLQGGVSDRRTVDSLGPEAVARKPVINSDVEEIVTSHLSRKPAASHSEGVSKSRLPRTSAKKNHSSPRLKHTTPPVLDGRITEWVRSVQLASPPPDANIHQTDTMNVSVSQELELPESIHPEDNENHEDVEVEDKEETGSVATSSHSLYEREVDQSLETASLYGCTLMSSDEDAASLSNCRVGRLHDGVPDGAADGKQSELQNKENIPALNIPDDVLKAPVMSPCTIDRRSRLIEPVVWSTSNCSRYSSSPPVPQRSSSFPCRCLSSPRKNSSLHGDQSPKPSGLKLPNTTKASSPTRTQRCSDTVCERSQPSCVKKSTSSVAEQDKIRTNVSSQKSHKALNQNPQQSKSGSSRNVDRCHMSVGKNSLREAKVDGKTSLPVAVKRTSEAGDEHCLVSPYHTVTSPRRRGAGCSTSSDNSSQLSDAVTARSKSSEVELSSGYESMLRDDSDEMITGHCTDWTSNNTRDGIAKCHHTTSSCRPLLSSISESTGVPSVPTVESCVWMHTTSTHIHDDIVPHASDVTCGDYTTSTAGLVNDAEVQATLSRIQRVDDLLVQQNRLKSQLIQLKTLLSSDSAAEITVSMEDGVDRDRADPEFLRILELQTSMLERRVRACQARIMLVTCFDSRV